MKKSLLVWGALIVIALCFVGCCYYNTSHHHCKQCENSESCPDGQNGDDVETMTVEAVEIVPLNPPASGKKATPDHGSAGHSAAKPAAPASSPGTK